MGRKFILYFVIILSLYCILSYGRRKVEAGDGNVSDKIIRFHVVANSDSPEDQALKLKVRDRILNEIGPEMSSFNSKAQSEEYLGKNIEHIKNIAKEELAEYGSDYDVAVELKKSSFPVKMYSNIALPAGEYDALKVTIGNGQGKNWWCVMFPPLCFVDVTHGVTDETTEEELKKVLDEGEYESLLAKAAKTKLNEAVKKPVVTEGASTQKEEAKTEDKMEIRFKSVEVAKSIWAGLGKLFGSEGK